MSLGEAGGHEHVADDDEGVFGEDPDGELVDGREDAGVELVLLPPPLPGGAAPRAGAGTDGGADDDASRMSVRQRKLVLRDANADVARELVRATGWSHPQVNAELNRLAGIRRISEATLEQLERRLAEGRRWLRST